MKRCTDSRGETVIAAIDTERDMLSNRRVDVDAAKLRYTSVNTAEEMKVGSGSGRRQFYLIEN